MNISYQHLNIDQLLIQHYLIKRKSSTHQSSLQFGFTLLEMVLVLFLVGLMASATLMLTDNVEDQAKYDVTKQRMEMMRKAIVGDPTRTVNGGPEISGFAADMGRLPGCIKELLEQVECATTTPLDSWVIDPTTGIGFGWRGPYVQVSPERSGYLRFRDGYGNSDVDDYVDALYSGWIWRLFNEDDVAVPVPPASPTAPEIIRVQSKGFDNTTPYPAGDINDVVVDNRPHFLVTASDWKIQLSDPISINFINQSTNNLPTPVSEKLVFRIYQSDLTAFIDTFDGTNNYLEMTSESIPASSQQPIQFPLSSTELPIGHYGYAVVCYEAPPVDPTDNVIFDGDCDKAPAADPNPTATAANIKYFTVAPRQNITLDWIIK